MGLEGALVSPYFPVSACVSLSWGVGDPTVVSSISSGILFVGCRGRRGRGRSFFGFVSPMFEAADNNKDMVKLLIDNEAKVNYENKDGWTALLGAVHSINYDRMPSNPIPLHPAQLPGVERTGRGCELPYRFAGSVWRRRKFVLCVPDCSPWLWLTKYYAERTVSGG